MSDWIKRDDVAFDGQQNQMRTWLAVPGNVAASGLTTDDISLITDAGPAWDTAYDARVAHELAGAPLTNAKETKRGTLVEVMRGFAAVMRARVKLGSLTEAQLLAAGIPPADTTPSDHPTPTTHPVLRIDASERLEQTFQWRDSATPDSKARPTEARHAEIRIALTAVGVMPPADPATFPLLIIDPSTPNTQTFDAADAAKTAHAVGRWIGKNGEPGPWSPVVSATIQQ